MSDSNPTPSTVSREEAISLAQSEKSESRVLENLPAQFPEDEEVWKPLLANPQTPLGAMIFMAERASSSLAAELADDRVFLLHNPVVGHALLKNPALSETDRRKVNATLHESTKDERERKKSLFQMIKEMSVGQKLALAKKGNKEARMILIKDQNEMIGLEVVNSPRTTDDEILMIAQMRDVSDQVLRAIANMRRVRANKLAILSLLHNPKTPVGVSLGLGISSLTDRDLQGITRDRNIPAAVSRAAKQVMESRSKGPKTKAH
ncbi:MAG: hypothetical protein O6929_05895 [candidate division NC10 bacterium]|nr:hypothetical protein [candidate division NC10 bacterium]